MKKSLTVENATLELVGDTSRAYPEVQNVCYEFAVANWKQVEKSAGMKDVVGRLEREELPGSVGALLLRLGKDGRIAKA